MLINWDMISALRIFRSAILGCGDRFQCYEVDHVTGEVVKEA